MASINKANKNNRKTHEGAQAHSINAYQELRRSVLACLLWENQFYESGEDIVTRISNLVKEVDPSKVSELAIEARTKQYLRHIPLLLAIELAKNGNLKKELINSIVQRPDELTELLALYWRDGKKPLPAQLKKGLALAFQKFDEYQLAKYNRKKDIKLLDVMRLVHPMPKDSDKAELWRKLRDGELKTPDTWETNLSSGKDKKATFERLIIEKKLGGLAFLRNLRNMHDADVNEDIIIKGFNTCNFSKVLPFRFIAAQNYVPGYTEYLEKSMLSGLSCESKISGKTVLLIDTSGSMVYDKISSKSELDRLDAAAGLSIILRERCEKIKIYAFSNYVSELPPYHGFALRDVLRNLNHVGTYLMEAIKLVTEREKNIDRMIVITDEQTFNRVEDPSVKGYMINVASYQNGVGYGKWIHIDGWSESIVKYITEYENM